MGEPAGIGTELLLKAWQHFRSTPEGQGPSFFLIDDPVRVEKVARALDLSVPIATLNDVGRAQALFSQALPVMSLAGDELEGLNKTEFGQPQIETASAVISSLERAVRLTAEKKAAGIVTLPIQKEILAKAGFSHPGHTEYLQQATRELEMPFGGERGAVMILTAGPFRVVPLTVHVPLRDVPDLITPERIIRTATIVYQSIQRDYGIPAPRIAISGLNPHAGEAGQIGEEEIKVIIPAIKSLQENGMDVIGPFPADTMFHEEARSQYHVAICMYHDQALLPIKTAAFHAAVNTTLGLPIVRTSPDHGTGLDIAGKGLARPDSLINAIYTADRIALDRKSFASRTGISANA